MASVAPLLLLVSLSVCTAFDLPVIADKLEFKQRRGIAVGFRSVHGFSPLRERLAENATSTPPSGAFNQSESDGGNKTDDLKYPPPVGGENDRSNASASTETKNAHSNPDEQVKDCGESYCEDSFKLIRACLRTPGDGMHILSLLITFNASDTKDTDQNITVLINTPEFLIPSQSEVSLQQDFTETIRLTVNPNSALSEIDVTKVKNITIEVSGRDDDYCQIAVPIDYLLSILRLNNSWNHPSSSALSNPILLHAILLLLAVSLVSATGWLCYKFAVRNHSVDMIRHQQLEMTAPDSPPSLIEEVTADGWDETWDDDWDDAEAAKSSSLLRQSLSSRGLAARRGNKDGWDD